ACSDGAPGALDGRVFLLQSSQGFQPVPDTQLSVSFDDGEIFVSAGCNSQGGPFRLRGGRLELEGLGTTDIGCIQALAAQDDWLAHFLTSKPQLTLHGDQLTLESGVATLVLLDREVADPDRPLAGPAWTIDSFIASGGWSNGPMAAPITVTF